MSSGEGDATHSAAKSVDDTDANAAADKVATVDGASDDHKAAFDGDFAADVAPSVATATAGHDAAADAVNGSGGDRFCTIGGTTNVRIFPLESTP